MASRASEKPIALSRRSAPGVVGRPLRADLGFGLDDAADLRQEPRIDLAGSRGSARRSMPSRIACATFRSRSGVGVPSAARIAFLSSPWPRPSIAISSRPVRPVSSERSAFCSDLLEGAADRHHLADRLHRGGQHRLGAGEFLEGEARDLGDDVVDGRLERGRRRAAGDVVGDLVERVADRELGGDLGDREAGRLRGERRGARHARVHLDDDQPAVRRVDRELHVRAAGLDPDLAQHRDRGVAHDLVFLVGQRQRRRDGDRVAGVHAHRIEVLDRADDDAVVALVAHHLHLEFLPAEHRFPRSAPRWSARRRARARRSRGTRPCCRRCRRRCRRA